MKLPLHPMFVHFPIAFCVLEFFFLILWFFKKEPAYLRFARIVFGLTFVSIGLAMIAGFRDAGGLKGIHGETREHAVLALGFLGVYFLRSFLWRFGKKENRVSRLVLLGGAFIGLILVAVTGYLGGELVFSGAHY